MTSHKAFVLLSGGIDSTTTLFRAIHEYGEDSTDDINRRIDLMLNGRPGEDPITWVEAIGINYGQRHLKETEYAKMVCDLLGIQYTVLDVGPLLSGKGVMLTNTEIEVPHTTYDKIQGVSPTYVPFRNGLMLSAITAHAQKWVNQQIDVLADRIKRSNELGGIPTTIEAAKKAATTECYGLAGVYAGMHAEDAHNFAYPDCTPEFLGAMANAISVGSYYTIKLHTPYLFAQKHQVVREGSEFGVPYDLTWSCYKGEEFHCGQCPTCESRKEAFKKANVADPTLYVPY